MHNKKAPNGAFFMPTHKYQKKRYALRMNLGLHILLMKLNICISRLSFLALKQPFNVI
jgi:hypothetical protein